MTATYRIIPYDEAHAASERGETVEMRSKLPLQGWQPLREGYDNCLEFRVLDPYAELKAAKEEGKVIQYWHHGNNEWADIEKPDWNPADRYRVKPDELVFEPGKEYRTREGFKARVYVTDAAFDQPIIGEIDTGENGPVGPVLWSDNGQYLLEDQHCYDLVAPWTDTPEPYDNWDKVPAWHNYQFKSPVTYRWFSIGEEPKIAGDNWRADDYAYALLIPIGFAPTNFTGTWETSLQARPTTEK